MSEKRRQLTLFVTGEESFAIEKIRKQFNPRQYKLIQSHVTLCRDEELDNYEALLQNLQHLYFPAVVLGFGNAIRFSDGNGVLLPVTAGLSQFQSLRKAVLQNIVATVKKLQPHITLMHPRNSTCTDEMFEQIQKSALPQNIAFRTVSLIEQVAGNKWNTLAEFNLM